MKVGDLVKVIAEGLRPLTGSIGLVTKMESKPKGVSGGTVFYCWALISNTGETYKFRTEHLEVINASR